MISKLLLINNLFATLAKLRGLNFLSGNASDLYDERIIDQNSENPKAGSTPLFPRVIWLSPKNAAIRKGGATTYAARLRFSVPERYFIKDKPEKSLAEKEAFIEDYALGFWFDLCRGSYSVIGLGGFGNESNAEFSTQKYVSKNDIYYETDLSFSIQITSICPTVALDIETPTPIPYQPLAPKIKDLPTYKDIVNYQHY